MKKKKNRFLLFIFSLMPGAGHMYLGFMKMGVSLALSFLVSVAVMNIIGVWGYVVFVIYMYSFFHANNLGALEDERFYAVEDNWFCGLEQMEEVKKWLTGQNRKIFAVILIILGVFMLCDVGFGLLCDTFGWDNPYLREIYHFVRDDLPRLVIGFAIIWIGIKMIRGKKKEILLEEKS